MTTMLLMSVFALALAVALLTGVVIRLRREIRRTRTRIDYEHEQIWRAIETAAVIQRIPSPRDPEPPKDRRKRHLRVIRGGGAVAALASIGHAAREHAPAVAALAAIGAGMILLVGPEHPESPGSQVIQGAPPPPVVPFQPSREPDPVEPAPPEPVADPVETRPASVELTPEVTPAEPGPDPDPETPEPDPEPEVPPETPEPEVPPEPEAPAPPTDLLCLLRVELLGLEIGVCF